MLHTFSDKCHTSLRGTFAGHCHRFWAQSRHPSSHPPDDAVGRPARGEQVLGRSRSRVCSHGGLGNIQVLLWSATGNPPRPLRTEAVLMLTSLLQKTSETKGNKGETVSSRGPTWPQSRCPRRKPLAFPECSRGSGLSSCANRRGLWPYCGLLNVIIIMLFI